MSLISQLEIEATISGDLRTTRSQNEKIVDRVSGGGIAGPL